MYGFKIHLGEHMKMDSCELAKKNNEEVRPCLRDIKTFTSAVTGVMENPETE
jgi:hypothetical protein